MASPDRIPKKVLDAYRKGEEAHRKMSAAGGNATAEKNRKKRAENELLTELAIEDTVRSMQDAADARGDHLIPEDDR